MPITELALIHLLPPTTVSTPTLRTHLLHAKRVCENYTSRPFYFLQQIEDPSYIYILGEWASVHDHVESFIPSPANQEILENLKGMIEIEYLMHIDVENAALPVPRPIPVDPDATAKELKYGAKDNVEPRVWSVVRHFVKEGEKEKFGKAFEANKEQLQEYHTEGTMGGGWRIGGNEGEEEFVLLTGYKELDTDIQKTEASERCSGMGECMEGADVRHAKLWVL